MPEGIVTKAHRGFYWVFFAGKNLKGKGGPCEAPCAVPCILRGRLRKEGPAGPTEVVVGDRVRYTLLDDGTGIIEETFSRTNELARPKIANVHQVVVVMAFVKPLPNYELLDRLLVAVVNAGLDTLICFNKTDLSTRAEITRITTVYKKAGYKVLRTSAKEGKGIIRLRASLRGKISVFAGPSGAGKSALLNAIQPGLMLRTGEVSEKIKRGTHTTRHVELLLLSTGGLVADTPGFSRLDISSLKKETLGYFFPEIARLAGRCRFTGCLHYREPGCFIKDAIARGEVNEGRYGHYVEFLEEIIDAEQRRYK